MITNPNATISNRHAAKQSKTRKQQQSTYRAIVAEAELAERIEDAAIWPVIRKNESGESVFVNVRYTELTAAEIRAAYNNAFYTYSEGA